MKKLNYDLDYAISIRGNNWEMFTDYPYPVGFIGFKDSIAISSDSNWNPSAAPSIQHEVAYYCPSAYGTHYKNIPKREWKEAWRGYRKYQNQSNVPDENPAGESDISVNNLGADGGAMLFGYM